MLQKRKPKLNSFTNINKLLHSKNLGKSTYFYKQRWFSYSIPLASTLALLLVMGCMINPVSSGSGGGEKVYAAGEVVSPDPDDSTDTTTDTTNMSVSLTMADPDKTLLQQNAKAGEMSYISSEFTVTTENVDGYNVYVQTAPGSTNKLTNGNITIDFVTTETPASNFTDNTWGYAVDDTGTTVENLKYNPVPDTASIMNPAYTSSSTGETRNFTLNFATKFAKDATPGHYTSGVLLSVAAGAGEVVSGFEELTFMQDMTTSICESAPEGSTKRLYDIRDGNKYWVAKLKDGNCWMTQNLAYDASGSELGIPSSWGNDNTASKYFNPGDYVYTTPTTPQSCGTSSINSLASCTSKGWTNVAGWTASDDPNYNEVANSTTKIYDAHYLAGNYYTYVAATANTAPSATGEATNSICPAGWQLPVNSGNKSYDTLLTSYGTNNGLLYGTQDMRLAPLYFVYGGLVGSSSLSNAGSQGRYWSSTANGSVNAYNLNFDTSVNPSSYNGRYIGYSVRCVAR